MSVSNFFEAYFNRDLAAINSDLIIPDQIRTALTKHWGGDLTGALNILNQHALSAQPSNVFFEFTQAEILLLKAKLGVKNGVSDYDTRKFKTIECAYISDYALFSLSFWIDHKIARMALFRLLKNSLFMKYEGSTLMAIFLICHLAAIAGWKNWPFFFATKLYTKSVQQIRSRQLTLFQNIVIAAFPYTIFVSNKISEKLTDVLSTGEANLPYDPYYRSLFNVSGLYCYAYSGDVTRTELYVSRLEEIQNNGELLRYKPVSQVMKFLPFALRGYGFLIAGEFKSLMASQVKEGAHTVILSQFYRAASIIYLSLGEFTEAEKMITLTMKEREFSNSFSAWERFDSHVLMLARKRQEFNPQFDPILAHKLQFESNSQFMRFFTDLIGFVSNSVSISEDEFYRQLKMKFSEHLAHGDIEVRISISDQEMTSPAIKMGSRFFIFKNVLKEREIFIRSILNSMGPISKIIMDGFFTQKQAQEYERNKLFSTIATQVSHDIRSPLSALNMILGQLDTLPEQSRVLVRASVNRISDIANSLLSHNKTQNSEPTASQVEVTMLASLIDSVVSEKRIALRGEANIQLEACLGKSYGLFAKINPNEMKRLLSNSINNSSEAFKSSDGLIQVLLESTSDKVILTIKDNGVGIPPHILEKLGSQGVTHGKEGTQSGSGLGVYHAKKTIEGFGGKYDIQSTLGQGTAVIISLKKEDPPDYFVQRIVLRRGQTIVAIDDDSSVLEIWKQRFAGFLLEGGVSLVACTSGACLRDWVVTHPGVAKESIYLMDFELLGHRQTGLDLIEELGLKNRAILVSSRYEESPIKERCSKLGIKLIPKGMAPLVPIELEEKGT